MKAPFLGLLISMSCLISCLKEDIGPKLKREADEKILGKWNIEKIVQQEYDPIPTLVNTNLYLGTTEDYYFFKADEIVEINTASTPQTDLDFEVINPYQIWIGDQAWRITELSDKKLTLNKDRNDVDNNKRSVTNIYLIRP
jgi:hypothetical protein